MDGGGKDEAQPQQEAVKTAAVVVEDEEAVDKKKSDDLWASFLSDVGSRPKDSTPASQSSTTQKVKMF